MSANAGFEFVAHNAPIARPEDIAARELWETSRTISMEYFFAVLGDPIESVSPQEERVPVFTKEELQRMDCPFPGEDWS